MTTFLSNFIRIHSNKSCLSDAIAAVNHFSSSTSTTTTTTATTSAYHNIIIIGRRTLPRRISGYTPRASSSLSSSHYYHSIFSKHNHCQGLGFPLVATPNTTTGPTVTSYRNFTTSTTATARTTTSTTANNASSSSDSKTHTHSHSQNKNKTPGDIFLDNLGTLFLSAIGLLILALIRSSRGTTLKNNLRTFLETSAALDPFEIDDLRTANDEFTASVFLDICMNLERKYGWTLDQKIDYKLFVSAVMEEMKERKGEEFTIQLGHLLDRVIVSVMESNDELDSSSTEYQNHDHENGGGGVELRLLCVALTLAMNSTVRERVEVLYRLLSPSVHRFYSNSDSQNHSNIREKDVIQMVGYLQKTCQLVPDAQIIESPTKFPVQEYLVGSPRELVALGKVLKKEELSSYATSSQEEAGQEEDGQGWTCDDFHHLLRSKSVCAWGECYVKKKGLI